MRMWSVWSVVALAGWWMAADGSTAWATDVATSRATRMPPGPLNLKAGARVAPAAPQRKPEKRPPAVIDVPGITAAPAEDATGAIGTRDAGPAGRRPPGGGSLRQDASRGDAAAITDPAQYCSSIVDTAADARLAWQMKELEAAEGRVRQRIAELEAKRAEYEAWLKLREDFLKKAEDNVVDIYSRMRPDAAAVQLAAMVDDTAAAVLAKLSARTSSAIFNEMEPARAAHLANTLAGMRRVDGGKNGK
jgi:flagellar motility protein MotE (MotC chaperone)